MSLDVLENIRIRSVEINEQRSTSIRTALIVPGGVRRAICNCAALAALNHLGIRHFDSVYAVSAGAINAAYGLANQAALAVTVYLEEVNKFRFINPLRFWNIIDLDYLFRDVQRAKPLDIPELHTNPSQLRILTADITNGQAKWFAAKTDDMINVMRAACSTEAPFSRPVCIEGNLYRDGYLLEPIPILSALKENYTDILVLLNKPLTMRDAPVAAWLQKSIINPWNKKNFGAGLVERCENGWKTYNQALDIIHSGIYKNSQSREIRIAAIAPDLSICMFEMRAKRLFQAACSSWENTLRAFGAKESDKGPFLKVLSDVGLKRSTLRKLG